MARKVKKRPKPKAKTKAARKKRAPARIKAPEPEVVALDSLKAHPRNYRSHPDDQIEHITASIRSHGIYRNVVVAKDGTILAGHGVVEAARKLKMKQLPVIRLNLKPDDPLALKVLTGDNMLGHFAKDNDRLLTEILRDIRENDELLGTGFDERMLANLLMVTRPQNEIATMDEAAEWAGLPSFDPEPDRMRLILTFDSEKEREGLAATLKLLAIKKTGLVWSSRWPPRERDDCASVRLEG